jgi:hypothetical protein
MEELNEMNLDEIINDVSNSMTIGLDVSSGLDIQINKDDTVSLVQEQSFKDKAMEELKKFEELQNKKEQLEAQLTLANGDLDILISKIKVDNKELIDKINSLANEIKSLTDEQNDIKETLVPLQKGAFEANDKDKTLIYNRIQSTYVEATEKNQFDLKTFRTEQKDFWEKNLDVLRPYAKITNVSDYVKVTIK